MDELYEALGEVVGAEEGTECYKSYLLVPDVLQSYSEPNSVMVTALCLACVRFAV